MIASTCRIVQRVALARLVAVPAGAGLLAEAPLLAQAVADARPRHARSLDVAPLADLPADVESREVAHAERPHRHAEALERAVDLGGRGALLDQEHRLAQVVLDHPVADEPVAHAGHDGGLADALGELHRGGERSRRRCAPRARPRAASSRSPG
jgi:hypothetical protein